MGLAKLSWSLSQVYIKTVGGPDGFTIETGQQNVQQDKDETKLDVQFIAVLAVAALFG